MLVTLEVNFNGTESLIGDTSSNLGWGTLSKIQINALGQDMNPLLNMAKMYDSWSIVS